MIKSKTAIIYQAKSGAIELRGDFTRETVWATQAQIAIAFSVDNRTINEHITNIYQTKELMKNTTLRNFRIVKKEGDREVVREVNHYNLDLILSVGYRVNSKQATRFRQWATKTLRNYIIDGYAINKTKVAKNYAQFLSAIDDIKKLLPASTAINPNEVIELISLFADTWLSLEAYDKDTLPTQGATKKSVALTIEKLSVGLAELKKILFGKGEATDLFGHERSADSVAGIVNNVMQSFGGQELYQTAEEKAAHLLYFMIKDHPFIDGNKRNGAYAFIWFLRQARILDLARLTPTALTALTILVAESDPAHKEKIIKLILSLIIKKS